MPILARPTSTNSPRAPPPSTPPTRPPTTRGIPSACPAVPVVAPPPPSPHSRHRSPSATDTGGSIRQPGALTAPWASNPPTAASPRFGAIAMASSLDQIGPVSRTVLDSALLQEIIGGHDKRDSTSIPEGRARWSPPPREVCQARSEGDEGRPQSKELRRRRPSSPASRPASTSAVDKLKGDGCRGALRSRSRTIGYSARRLRTSSCRPEVQLQPGPLRWHGATALRVICRRRRRAADRRQHDGLHP